MYLSYVVLGDITYSTSSHTHTHTHAHTHTHTHTYTHTHTHTHTLIHTHTHTRTDALTMAVRDGNNDAHYTDPGPQNQKINQVQLTGSILDVIQSNL